MKALAAGIPKQLEFIQTEEATKHALVMPFIQALGYNVFDPSEVTPELVADVGTKKGEKVDYAILIDRKPVILFECKWCGSDLDQEHASQLFRYFSVTAARFGVLTNGILYRFFTDLEEPNKMDSKPFFEFNMLNFTDAHVEEMKRFTRTGFVLDQAVLAAADLKYTREVKRIMGEQLAAPSEEFVRFFASQIHSGRLTQTARSQFTEITRRALQQFISERIADRLKSALDQEAQTTKVQQQDAPPPVAKPAVKTTEEEREAFYIVKSILREVIDPRRVASNPRRADLLCDLARRQQSEAALPPVLLGEEEGGSHLRRIEAGKEGGDRRAQRPLHTRSVPGRVCLDLQSAWR